MRKYLTTDGVDLSTGDSEHLLRLEYVLQRYRDVWVAVSKRPYLAIEGKRVEEYLSSLGEFAVFSSALLFQNMSGPEFGRRFLASLLGPGLTAGFSPSGGVVVDGMANPQAYGFQWFNEPLSISTHPFAASGTHYIYVTPDALFQRQFADLVSVNKLSRPKSAHIDFDPLSDLVEQLRREHLANSDGSIIHLDRISSILDDIFAENQQVLAAAADHHRAMAPHEMAYEYLAPVLTKYGRLTHNSVGDPCIEVSFALLHYESALRLFNELKEANAREDQDAAFRYGVYCAIAAAACVEAVGNILVFRDTGQHPDHRDKRKPLEKINKSGSAIAHNRGVQFRPLDPKRSPYVELDALRAARNSFVHATETATAIDPQSRMVSIIADVDESACRTYLKSLRVGVAHVFDQLPNMAPPIVTKTNVTWLQDMEVP